MKVNIFYLQEVHSPRYMKVNICYPQEVHSTRNIKVNIYYPQEVQSPRYMKVNFAAHKRCIALDIYVTRTSQTAAIQKPEGKYLPPARGA